MRQPHRPSLSSAPFRASLLVLLALALFIAIFWIINEYQSYQQSIANIERNYKELYRERVHEELNNVLEFGAGTSHEIIKTTLQEEILAAVQNMRFSKNGHILCFDSDGTILSHPNTVFIGRSIIDMMNEQGEAYGEEMLQTGLQSTSGA